MGKRFVPARPVVVVTHGRRGVEAEVTQNSRFLNLVGNSHQGLAFMHQGARRWDDGGDALRVTQVEDELLVGF